MDTSIYSNHDAKAGTMKLMAKALASSKALRHTLNFGKAPKHVSSCSSSPLDVFQTPTSPDHAITKLILQREFDYGEHIICNTSGETYFHIPAVDQQGGIRSITDEAGVTLCSLFKRDKDAFELLCDSPHDPVAAVINVTGKPGKPKLEVLISKHLVPGECNALKVKGDLLGLNFKVIQYCPDSDEGPVTLVSKSTPIENGDRHELKIAPLVDMSLMVALCLVISQIRESIHNIQIEPPLVILSPQWVSQKKAILTPVIIDDMLAVVDCDLNTIVYRDSNQAETGRGQFWDVNGKCSFVLEACGKNLCLFLRGKPGMRDSEVLVFSKKRKPRGVREMCVSKVNSSGAMRNKAARKAGCLMGIRVDCQNEPEIRMPGKEGKPHNGQLIGRAITAGLSPTAFSETLEKCHSGADPRNSLLFEHFGVCMEVAAGVDLELMSAVILAMLVFVPKLGKPCEGELSESLAEGLRECDSVLGLEPLDG
ncbi:hypothetical protein BSKO_07595 [Bryopsis sp. KO-2023]|nr:hypothetical protein BSKO_07595 [Bryopsis sp. KO-2023]